MTHPMSKNSDDNEKFNISCNVIYEITINPDDKHQHANKGDTRFTNVKSDVQSVFDDFHSDIKYHLFGEMSMPQFGNQHTHRYARCHYHGIILFKTPAAVWDWLTIRWHKLTGQSSVQLNPYRPEKWDAYVRKQQWLVPKRFRIRNHLYQDIKNLEEVLQTESLDESSQDSLPKGKNCGKRRRKAAAEAKRKE